MKHRRSASKRGKTRGDHRYDEVLRKFKKMKAKGGKFASRVGKTSIVGPSHRVTPDNPIYKGVKVINVK